MRPSVLLGIVGGAVILLVLFEMLRRQRLREKYAVLWFVVAVAALVLAFVPGVLTGAARLAGVEVPANLLFFLASMVLMLMTLQHSHELGSLEEKTRALAEEIALLRLDLDRRVRGADGHHPAPARHEPPQPGVDETRAGETRAGDTRAGETRAGGPHPEEDGAGPGQPAPRTGGDG